MSIRKKWVGQCEDELAQVKEGTEKHEEIESRIAKYKKQINKYEEIFGRAQ